MRNDHKTKNKPFLTFVLFKGVFSSQPPAGLARIPENELRMNESEVGFVLDGERDFLMFFGLIN